MTQSSEVTIITGGGRGIGAATAIRLAQHLQAERSAASELGPKPHIIVNYRRDADSANHVVEHVRSLDVEASAVAADVSTEPGVLALFAAADAIGRLAGLVNNAGIVGPIGRFEDLDIDRLNNMWAVNLTSCFVCSREAVRRMSTRNDGSGGSIVNVSSRAASLGSPNEFIDYAATKGAMDTMTIGLATEVADEAIRVNSVRPGLIDTTIHADAGMADRIERFADRIPMRRGGRTEEVANLIVWLLSEQASFVTGALIDVAGGR